MAMITHFLHVSSSVRSFCLSIYLSIYLSVCLSVCLPVCLFVSYISLSLLFSIISFFLVHYAQHKQYMWISAAHYNEKVPAGCGYKYTNCNVMGHRQQPANNQPLRWKMPCLGSQPVSRSQRSLPRGDIRKEKVLEDDDGHVSESQRRQCSIVRVDC